MEHLRACSSGSSLASPSASDVRLPSYTPSLWMGTARDVRDAELPSPPQNAFSPLAHVPSSPSLRPAKASFSLWPVRIQPRWPPPAKDRHTIHLPKTLDPSPLAVVPGRRSFSRWGEGNGAREHLLRQVRLVSCNECYLQWLRAFFTQIHRRLWPCPCAKLKHTTCAPESCTGLSWVT